MLQNAPYQLRFWMTLVFCAALVWLFLLWSRKLSQKTASNRLLAVQLLVTGFAPLLAGLLLSSFLMAFQNVTLPFPLVSIAVLIGWAAIAWFWSPELHSTLKVVALQNLVPGLVLLLIGVQLLGIHRFWSGIIGVWSQDFYLPVLNLGYTLTRWSTSQFPAFCAAFLLLLAASAAGCGIRKGKEERKRIPSMRAITWLLIGAILGTWLVSMTCLTVVTAQEIYDKMYAASYELPDSVNRSGGFSDFYDPDSGRYGMQYERPDLLEYNLLRAISGNLQIALSSQGDYGNDAYHERGKLIRDILYPMETAVLLYDGEGNLLHSSADDVMFFSYYTQEEWDAGMDTVGGLHYGWIDISEGKDAENWEEDPYLRFRSAYAGVHHLWDFTAIRVTGYFDGSELKPVTMHYITETQVWQLLDSTDQFSTGEDSYAYTISGLDRTGKLDWQLQFDRSGAYTGGELVTVYMEYPAMWDYEGTALTYGGETYESLAALTEELDFPAWTTLSVYNEELRGMGSYRLNELLVFTGRRYFDYAGFDYASGGEPETELILVTAARGNPLSCAMNALRNIYIVTGLLALILIKIVRGSIQKHFVQPVEEIADAMEDGWKNLYRPDRAPVLWLEAKKLSTGFTSEQDRRRMKDNEITRLNTALDYAKTAEQNRRQMTSAIAHELKTPLAVIHSYAEGLKEHIAEEKREQYLEVILSETERMDAMVLELLDLSRLEAGRVKLSRDEVALPELTRAIFAKLDRDIQARNLHVTFEVPDRCVITADESRIGQVIENFATNAVKYTPEGGNIRIRIDAFHRGTTFSVENDSQPLSPEALAKVWDTFYRVDEARGGVGTGLGLAIAKNIIELHGGRCAVRNTGTGVEFSFTL